MKNNIPSWFEGNVYDYGKTIINPRTNKELKINNIEASIYDMANGHLLQLKEIKKDTELSKMYLEAIKNATGITDTEKIISSMKKDFDLAVKWFKENNLEIHEILIEEYSSYLILNNTSEAEINIQWNENDSNKEEVDESVNWNTNYGEKDPEIKKLEEELYDKFIEYEHRDYFIWILNQDSKISHSITEKEYQDKINQLKEQWITNAKSELEQKSAINISLNISLLVFLISLFSDYGSISVISFIAAIALGFYAKSKNYL